MAASSYGGLNTSQSKGGNGQAKFLVRAPLANTQACLLPKKIFGPPVRNARLLEERKKKKKKQEIDQIQKQYASKPGGMSDMSGKVQHHTVGEVFWFGGGGVKGAKMVAPKPALLSRRSVRTIFTEKSSKKNKGRSSAQTKKQPIE